MLELIKGKGRSRHCVSLLFIEIARARPGDISEDRIPSKGVLLFWL